MPMKTGFIILFYIICVFISVCAEEIDLLEDLNHLPEVRNIIQHQKVRDNGKSFWYLNFTDVRKRDLYLSENRTKDVLNLLNENDGFGLCVIINQKSIKSGTIFSITRNNKEKILEITVLLKKNSVRIVFSPNWLEKRILKVKMEFLSTKSDWHYLCFEYSRLNEIFVLKYDCINEVKRTLKFTLPKAKFQLKNMKEYKIWIGQRNNKHGFFEGALRQMIFFSKSNYSSAFCASIFQNAVTMPVYSLTEVGSVEARLAVIETELYNLKMKLYESENKTHYAKQCQCFPVCLSFNGEKKVFSETWQENTCRNCTCTFQGTKCEEEKCRNLSCPNKVTDPGKCCQRCGNMCQYKGKNYVHGQNFKINCLKCQCNDGSLTCQRINPKLECKKLNCNRFLQVKVPGECCKICKKINLCDFNTCGLNAYCIASSTLFTCQCKQGFEGNPYQRCEDINECQQEGICPKSTECINTDGSYTCVCKPGYARMNSTSFGCIATCIRNKCKNNSSCIAPDKCECAAGYSGPECDVDIDECKLGLIKCPANSECFNIPGSYICRCEHGYKSNKSGTMSVYYDHQCEDINECLGTRGIDHFCNYYSGCVNNPGGYECTLNDLFSEDRSCEIEYKVDKIKQMEIDTEIFDYETCKQCTCLKNKIKCHSMKCNCSKTPSELCCRKCFLNECDSTSPLSVKVANIRGFDCMLANSTCPNKQCPKVDCEDSVEISGQCCKFCRSDHITSCILEYNKFAISSSVSNRFIPSCYYKNKEYKNGEKFITNHHMDGSCTKCLCWNQYFCCAKSFECRV